MRRPPRPQDNDCDDVDEHRDNDDGDDDENHRGAAETNAGESDGDDEIKEADIEEAYEIKEREEEEVGGEEAARRSLPTPKLPQTRGC